MEPGQADRSLGLVRVGRGMSENRAVGSERKTGTVVPLGPLSATAFHPNMNMNPQYEQIIGAAACQSPTDLLSNN